MPTLPALQGTKRTLPLGRSTPPSNLPSPARDFFIDNLHYIIVMIKWTGLAPREFELPESVAPMSIDEKRGVPGSYPGTGTLRVEGLGFYMKRELN